MTKRLQIPILKGIQRVPGGVLIIPLFLVALIHTAFPDVLSIGDPTTAVFTGSGSMTLIGVILFIAGCQFDVKRFGRVLVRGGVFLGLKVVLGIAVSTLCLATVGPDGVLGVSVVAMTIAIMSGNTGVYISMVQPYGNADDIGAVGIMNLEVIPALPVMVLCFSAGAAVDWMSFWAALVPFLVGVVLGNVDRSFVGFVAPAMNVMLLLLGCTFGASINILDVLAAGPAGVLLAVAYLVISVPTYFIADHFVLKGQGYAGVSFCSIAGITVMVPALVAATMPEYAPYAQAASMQLALAMAITTIAMPFIVKAICRRLHIEPG